MNVQSLTIDKENKNNIIIIIRDVLTSSTYQKKKTYVW